MSEKPFERFVGIIWELRDPETGCPWDLKQTHVSLKPYMIEEAYELLDAIEREDDEELCGELGDVLLQVVLHAQVAKDRNAFAIDDVIERIADKMVRRHPHVFGDVKAETAEQVIRNWTEIKQSEKADGPKSVLDGVPKSMPAAARAHQMGLKAGQKNFDWRSAADVWSKVDEEFHELQHEMQTAEDSQNVRKQRLHELGDLMFASAQLARWLGSDAESVLKSACDRFESRFRVLETSFGERSMADASDEELEQKWQEVKAQLANPTGKSLK